MRKVRKYIPEGYLTTGQVRDELGTLKYDFLYQWTKAGLIKGDLGKVGEKLSMLYSRDELPKIRRLHQLIFIKNLTPRQASEIMRQEFPQNPEPDLRNSAGIEYVNKKDLKRDFHDMPFPKWARKYGLID